MDYGDGLTVDWSPVELAKLEEYRKNASSRRVYTQSHDDVDGRWNGSYIRPEKMRELVRDVWGDVVRGANAEHQTETEKADSVDVEEHNRSCGVSGSN